MSPICHDVLMFYTIVTLFIIINVACEKNWQNEYEITRNFSEAVVEIVNTLFIDKFHRKLLNIHVKVQNNNMKHLHIFNKIIDETTHLLNDQITIRLSNGIAISTDSERHFCVLLVDSAKSLGFLYEDLSKYHLFVGGSYFIILRAFPHVHHYYDELYEISRLNWDNGITHADVLVHAVQNVILSFHSMPFTPYYCRGVAPVVHNKFIDGHWLHTEFHMPKSMNLHGCPLVCATREDMPYFQLNRQSNGDGEQYQGLEGRLLNYLATKMNFTITLRWIKDEERNQAIYDEQGVIDKLFLSGVDFVMAALYYKPTNLMIPYEPTTFYYLSDYYFVLSSKTEPYDSFTKLLLPFDTGIWIILVFIFTFGNVIVFIAIYLDRKLKSLVLGRANKTPAYNMVVISLGGAVTKEPKVPFSRFVLMLWLLGTFVLRTVYQGFMYHYIRSDLHVSPPKGVSDLLNNNYRILMSEIVYNSISAMPNVYAKANILNKTEVDSFEILRRPEDYEPTKLAILTPQEYYGYYRYITPINYDFYVLPQKFFTRQLAIYMKKNSVYLRRFNWNIRSYINEGLMNRWDRLLFYDSYRRQMDDRPKPMENSHLYGPYRLFLIGLCGSLLVFLGEVVIFGWSVMGRSFKRYWLSFWKRSRRMF